MTERTPAADARNVAAGINVTATFSEDVNGVTDTSVTLADAAGTAIPAAVSYDAETRTATLNPNAALAANTRYTVSLASTIGDAKGNMLEATSWSFTIAGPAPTVTGRTPAADATNVAVGTNVTATFSEAVTGVDTGTMTLVNPAGDTIPAAVGYANGTATLNPNANLAFSTRYTVKLTSGIGIAGGTALAATEWSFTTAAAPVDPAPTLTGRTPAVNATNVAVGTNVTATFSEAVTGIGSTTMRLIDPNGAQVAAGYSYNATTRTATLNPSANLATGTRYTVSLTNGIQDQGGNALAATSWSFTTDAAPTVTDRTPGTNATNVSRTGNVSATFSEAVTGASGTNVRLTSPSGATVAAVVTYNALNRTVTLNPVATLAANTRYTARLSGGIRDLGGNALATTTWSFTTDAVPTVTGRTPAANATNVSRTGNVSATFSEAVTGANGTNVRLTSPSGATVAAVVTYNSSSRTVTLNPSATLAANTRYTVRLSSGIRDAGGNALATTTWSFTTDALPTVARLTPGANATNVSRSGNITVQFSEAVSGVNAGSVRLTTSSGSTVSAAVSYKADTRTATINPRSQLAANTRYTVKVSSSIKDSRSNKLTATSWNFRTGAR